MLVWGGVPVKKFFVALFAVMMLAMLAVCRLYNTVDDKTAVLITAGDDETYFFSLEDDNTIKVRFGCRNGDDVFGENFTVISASRNIGERALSKEEARELKKLVERVCGNCVSSTEIVKDVWEVMVFHDNDCVRQWIYEDTDSEVKALIDKLEELSPLEIKMRGLA